MVSICVNCSYCNKSFNRPSRRYNEAIKFGWNQFCSKECLFRSKSKQIYLKCENCKKVINRKLSGISIHNYCSHSCAVAVNNKTHPRNPGLVQSCAFCKKEFKSREKYCSTICKNLNSRIPELVLVNNIKKFVKEKGRIPYKWELGNYGAVRGRFGTWNNAIKAAGFTPNPVMFANKWIAKDGDKCDSLAEKIIDDYLSRRNIKHIRNFPYPGDKGFTVDFKVGDFWIEFFGLSGQLKRYDQLMGKKIKLAKEQGLRLIKILPIDLFPKSKLDNLLGGCPDLNSYS